MILSNLQVTNHLVDDIRLWPFAVACWEGGSAANQRSDQYSDLDLVICIEDGNKEEAFAKIQARLSSLSKIDHMWRVPEPTWHGHSQCFYKLSGTSEFFFLDIVVMEKKSKQRFLEKERHGTPVIHFDKQNFIQQSSADTPDFWAKSKQRLQTIEASFPFFKSIVLKEIVRNRPLDALSFYRSLTNMLVELLGMKYRPFRYDFGLRYSYVDFPMEEQQALEKLCFVGNLREIESRLSEVESRMQSLISELKS